MRLLQICECSSILLSHIVRSIHHSLYSSLGHSKRTPVVPDTSKTSRNSPLLLTYQNRVPYQSSPYPSSPPTVSDLSTAKFANHSSIPTDDRRGTLVPSIRTPGACDWDFVTPARASSGIGMRQNSPRLCTTSPSFPQRKFYDSINKGYCCKERTFLDVHSNLPLIQNHWR